MKIVVRSSESDVIYLPVHLMDALGLQDGDLVQARVGDQTLRLSRLGRFLELRGALADDEGFDRAMELLDEAWRVWKPSLSV